nr:immunoglobulin heavy chain junction region [Macaca mulatta]MOV89937.1 immunoglobulin heavy chain junction region [Macaca mulatta]MOV90024.1 immunoglobulin heavy chain junction region [Macaca mulatta]MOV90204.1 immunoglobulin heavy chain junction region [Macaca mulatta]MOV91957.1 immunoglobulin heavy chain junction region [Macaca mulatta]
CARELYDYEIRSPYYRGRPYYFDYW